MAAKRRNQNQNVDTSSKSNNSGRSRLTRRNGGRETEKDNIKHERNHSYLALVLVLAVVCGVLHRNHLSHMFESDRHFSHLSTLERELAFRTEMGLYFSYYKTMIESSSFSEGLHKVMNDNITEYPLTINTLKRFNLYPEVVLAAGYRFYEAANAYFGRRTKICWTVNRGEGLEPVQSCEGLGEPSYFYVESVFLLNGCMMAIFFLFATYLSGSLFGGLLTVAAFFYNHGECTRVQWTPPLRESFAYPFFVVQMFIVTYIIRCREPGYKSSLSLALAIICFMLPWQFAQFALLIQTLAVFGTYVIGYLSAKKTLVILTGQLIGLAVSFILLFGNEMLLTSFYASCLFTVLAIVLLEPVIHRAGFRLIIWVVQGVLLVGGTLGLKFSLSRLLGVADDAHISDIFRSKFSNFQNFHTMLYTCAAEFDFMDPSTLVKLTTTLLLPAAVVVVLTVMVKVLLQEYRLMKQGEETETVKLNGSGDCPDYSLNHSRQYAEVVYHLLMTVAFTAMALIIMRLKLFWTPQLTLITSLLASPQVFGWVGGRERHFALVSLILAGMSVQGVNHLSYQWGILGEFSNYPMEEMVEWVKANTPQNAVFAGPMPTMATIKLSTNRPIVNHPHYEDAGLRERTKKVYSMYSRKPVEEVKQNLIDLQVDYAILEDSWCLRKTRPGCGMPEIWDIEDKVNRGGTPTCVQLKKDPKPHFRRVFKNNVYQILQVLK
ncbi:protein C-mannosyl-transferase DPY19L1-like [Liolophura sinensis]|uniref:protein C-mannosyl-transferase DPY19L1-like n=1 Tax=Liolophura sinensis TaxID=3198878 RepID=UPI0031580C28